MVAAVDALRRATRSRLLRLVALVVVPLAAGGCSSLLSSGTSEVAGVSGAAIASAVTSNAAVASGIGLGVQAVARTGLQHSQRVVHRAAQDELARTAGELRPGDVASWQTHHVVRLERHEAGRVTVSRVISTGALQCKEIVFSVDSADRRPVPSAFYVAAICREGATWKWASAEPATERWGSLQ